MNEQPGFVPIHRVDEMVILGLLYEVKKECLKRGHVQYYSYMITRNHLHKCTVKPYENFKSKAHLCKCVYIVTECTICSLVKTGSIFSLQMNNLPALSQSSEVSFHSLINPLNAELNPICHLLALLGAHHILHISRIRVIINCF